MGVMTPFTRVKGPRREAQRGGRTGDGHQSHSRRIWASQSPAAIWVSTSGSVTV